MDPELLELDRVYSAKRRRVDECWEEVNKACVMYWDKVRQTYLSKSNTVKTIQCEDIMSFFTDDDKYISAIKSLVEKGKKFNSTVFDLTKDDEWEHVRIDLEDALRENELDQLNEK